MVAGGPKAMKGTAQYDDLNSKRVECDYCLNVFYPKERIIEL
jgi:hypothetical protein